MPRDSSGNYTLPLGNPVIDGTVIDVNWANPTMSDIAVQLNNVLTRDGLLGPTQPFYLVDGSAAIPGLGFISSNNTGLFRPGGGGLGFTVAGVQKFALTASAATFSVAPTWAADPGSADQLTRKSYVDASISTAIAGIPLGNYLPLTGGNLAGPGNLNLTGSLGVGTTTPGAKAHIVNTPPAASPAWNAVDSLIIDATTNNVVQLHVGATGGSMAYAFAVAGTRSIGSVAYDVNANALFFNANSAERMRIDANGNLGVGTAPLLSYRLSVSAAQATIAVLNSTSVDGGFLSFMNSGTDYGLIGSGKALVTGGVLGQLAIRAVSDLLFSTGPNERMRITSAGLLGLGTNNPQRMIDVFQNQGGMRLSRGFALADYAELSFSGTTLAGSAAMIRSYRANDQFYGNEGDLRFYTNSGSGGPATDGVERMRIDSGGQLMLNMASMTPAAPAGYVVMGINASVGSYNRHFSGGTLIGDIGCEPNSYGITTRGAFPLTFSTNGAERMRIDSAGHVGIGFAPVNYGAGVNSVQVNSTGQAIFDLYISGTRQATFTSNNALTNFGTLTAIPLNFITNNSTRASIDSAGVFTYGGIEVGYRGLPRITSYSNSNGKCVALTAGITLNSGDGPAGSAVSFYNDSAAAITLTQGGGLTLRLAGTTTTGNRTLAPRGICTVWFNSTSEFIVSGAGVS